MSRTATRGRRPYFVHALGGRQARGRLEQDGDRSARVAAAEQVGVGAGGPGAVVVGARPAADAAAPAVGRATGDGRTDQQVLKRDAVDGRLVQLPVVFPGPGGRAQGLQRQPRVDFRRRIAVLGRDQRHGPGQLRQDIGAACRRRFLSRPGTDGARLTPMRPRTLLNASIDASVCSVAGNQQGLGPVYGRTGCRITVDRHGGAGIEHPGAMPLQHRGGQADQAGCRIFFVKSCSAAGGT